MAKENPSSPFDIESYKSHRTWYGRRIPAALSFSCISDIDPHAPQGLDVGHYDRDKGEFIYQLWVAAGTPGIKEIIEFAFQGVQQEAEDQIARD